VSQDADSMIASSMQVSAAALPLARDCHYKDSDMCFDSLCILVYCVYYINL